jgi:hypothetical protein
LGARYKLPGYDLESGLPTAWRGSVEDRREVRLKAGAPASLAAVLVQRREGAASLGLLREEAAGGLPLRVAKDDQARLVFVDPRLLVPEALGAGPVATVLRFLRAAASGDAAGVRGALDLQALYRRSGGTPGDEVRRRDFEEVLLDALLDAEWLESRGLLFVGGAVGPADLQRTPSDGDGPTRVGPEGGPSFLVQRGADEAWRIVELPKSKQD